MELSEQDSLGIATCVQWPRTGLVIDPSAFFIVWEKLKVNKEQSITQIVKTGQGMEERPLQLEFV